jgi:hypothetical protein
LNSTQWKLNCSGWAVEWETWRGTWKVAALCQTFEGAYKIAMDLLEGRKNGKYRITYQESSGIIANSHPVIHKIRG